MWFLKKGLTWSNWVVSKEMKELKEWESTQISDGLDYSPEGLKIAISESQDVDRQTEETKIRRDVIHWHVVPETGDITQLYSGSVAHALDTQFSFRIFPASNCDRACWLRLLLHLEKRWGWRPQTCAVNEKQHVIVDLKPPSAAEEEVLRFLTYRINWPENELHPLVLMEGL